LTKYIEKGESPIRKRDHGRYQVLLLDEVDMLFDDSNFG
jgi:hypothetical protein